MNKLNILVALLTVMVFSSCGNSNSGEYAKSPEELLSSYFNEKDFVSPEEMLKIAAAPEAKYRMIDIRTPDLFIKGHVANAVNIPLHDVLNPKYKDIFNDKNVTNIIYGSGNEDVIDICLMFCELGITGNKYFKGGYDFIATGGKSTSNINDEKPAYNFAEKLKELAGKAGSTVQSPVKNTPKKKPVIRRKKREAEGGCS
jgi:rhodanese-related sulfurtransferase